MFDAEAPGAVYVPAGPTIALSAATDAEVAICTAPGSGAGAPRLIPADRMGRETRGEGTNQRFVRNILPETEPAESLLIAEVITPSRPLVELPAAQARRGRPAIGDGA